MNGLMIHCGGRKASLEEVCDVATPTPTETHVPVPHETFLTKVMAGLKTTGFTVESDMYALRDGKHEDGSPMPGAQFFGLLTLRNGQNPDDYGVIAGIRNSHDKSISAGLAVGSQVFVCDNMAFSGEISFGRKHTTRILDDLDSIIRENLYKLPQLRAAQDARIEAYKNRSVSDNWARLMLCRTAEGVAEEGIAPCIPWAKLGKVWEQWKNPEHDAFRPRNAWSLFNGFTEVFKDTIVQNLPQKTMALHATFDKACEVAA